MWIKSFASFLFVLSVCLANQGCVGNFSISPANIKINLSYANTSFTHPVGEHFTSGVPTLGTKDKLDSCLVSPELPSGLLIDETSCVISGTPTEIMGSADFTVTATNSAGSSTAILTLVIAANTPLISFAGAAGTIGAVGFPMSVSPSTLNNRGAAISSCTTTTALPAGLSIDHSSCVISGTPTMTLASSSFTVTATNSVGSSTATIILRVAPSVPTISYAGATGTSGVVGVEMSISPTALIEWGAGISSCTTSTSLPAGLSIDNSTCVISGTPAMNFDSAAFSVTATNSAGSSSANVTLVIAANTPSISYAGATGISGNVAVPMSVAPTILNNRGAAISSCTTTTALPSGLSINNSTCVISGTPTVTLASTAFTVTATNSAGSSTAPVTLMISASAPTLSYLGTLGTSGVYGVAMSVSPVILNANGAAVSACSVSPSLSGGLSINSSTCVISGTPSAVSVATIYTVTVTNSAGTSTGSVTLSVAANSPLISYLGANGTSGSVGAAMTIAPTNLSLEGAEISSCTATTALPPGLSINNSTCVISGTPTLTLDSTAFFIRATNSAGSNTASVTLVIAPNTPSISYAGATGTNGAFGVAMSLTPTILNNRGEVITSCTTTTALPDGLSINNSTCVISGTPTLTLDSTEFTVTAVNSVGSSTASVTLVIAANTPSISFAGATGTSGSVGVAMSVTPTTLNNRGAAISSCLTNTALPTGLSIDNSTCVISGTPTVTLASTAFMVTANNSVGSSSANVTLEIAASVPNISYAGVTGTSGSVGVAMSVSPTTLNIRGAEISSCTTNTALPAGLSIDNSTCVISGTPTVTLASSEFTVTATNSAGSSTASVTLVITASVPTISYAGATGTSGNVAVEMSVSPTILHNSGAAISSCTTTTALPAGLSIDNSTCVISGTPTVTLASTAFTVTATNSAGSSTAPVTLMISASAPTLSYLGTLGTSGVYGVAMSVSPVILNANGAAVSACSVSPSLSGGLSINSSTCVISGTPSAVSVATIYTITVTNSAGTSTGSVTLSVAANSPSISYVGAIGTVGVAMTVTPSTLNDRGAAVSSCTTTTALPAGLSIDNSTCVISGTPTVALASTAFTVTATNSAGSTTTSATLVIGSNTPLISYVESTGTSGSAGVPMSVTPTTLNNRGAAISSCTTTTALPADLSIDNSTCVISGTPTVALALSAFTVTATNSAGSSTASVTLVIAASAPVLSYASSMGTTGYLGVLMTVTPSTLTLNGAALSNCTVSPALPAWATLNSSTCVISGTPNAILTSTTYTVTATNSAGSSAGASVTLMIADTAPVAAAITPAAFAANTQSLVTLSYTDAESNLGSSCDLSSLSNISITQACSCTVAGVCTVGVTGTSGYAGVASFNYTVTTNGLTSNSALATLSITGWIQEAYIKASNADVEDSLGSSISLSGDTLVAGTITEDSNQTTITNGPTASANNSALDSGAVYVFKRTGTTWEQEAYIKAANAEANDYFGYNVSISGNTIVVGAVYEDSNQVTITNGSSASALNTAVDSGAVYVYKRTGSNWAQEAYVKAANAGASDNYGATVSISGDTFVVGATYEDSNQTTITNGPTASTSNSAVDSGAAYVYRRTGTIWIQEAYIKAANVGASDCFGQAISISGDTIVVGAPLEASNVTAITNGTTASTNNSTLGSGAAYVYKRTGTTWAQQAFIKAANANADDNFGSEVLISEDTIVVGAPVEDSNQTTITNGSSASADNSALDSGAVYVYKRTGTNWAQEAYIKSSNSEAADYFGHYGSSLKGDTLVVRALQEDSNQTSITNGSEASADNSALTSGAAYVYKRTGTTWAQEAYFKATNSEAGDYFGRSTISGDTIVVRSYLEDSNQTTITNGTTASSDNSRSNSGALFVFRNNARLFEPSEFFATATSTSITLNWIKSGGTTTGYYVVYALGTTAPANCSSGTIVNVGNVTTYAMTSLPYNTTYSFRVCSTDGSTFSTGVAVTSTTDDAPVAIAITPENLQSDFQSIITLSYSDTEGHLATACTISALSNVTITRACACTSGVCTVGITAVTGYYGPVSFNYTVKANNLTSNTVTVSFAATFYGWYQEAYIKAANTSAGDFFGNSVSISGDTIVVGAPYEDSNQTTITNGTTASASDVLSGSGAAYVYKRSGSTWGQEAYIKASNTDALDSFGFAVSISGDTVAVSARDEESNQTTITNGTTASTDNSSTDSGAVYVYKRTGTSWSQEAYIKAANTDASDWFGYSVSISGDTLVVGAQREDSNQTTITNGTTASADNSASSSGAAYVYNRSGSTWAQQAYIKAANAESNDIFGNSVSISGDTIVVGAYNEGSNQTTITNGTTASANNTGYAGAAYVYKRSGSTWTQQAYIKAANAGVSDYFGFAVSISGNTLAVGALLEDSNQTTITNGTTASTNDALVDSGAAYVYKRTGSNWAQEAYIKASNAGAGDYVQTVSISGDTLVVGATSEDSAQIIITNGTTASTSNTASGSGAAYVYRRIGSTWSQEAYVKAANAGASDNFGISLSISGDTIVVGANGEDSNQTTITNGTSASATNTAADAGAAYVYRHTTRLFDVSELTATATSGSVTLNWIKSGGNATGYFVAYASGSTAPADCTSGTDVDVGNVATFTESPLSSGTTYSFRVCSTVNGSSFSEGVTATVTTP